MGMAASSLRFAQLTARKNQVEFEGQQINQQRLTLSQKSSAIYDDMLTKQVPTAPDPGQFTKIVYKFNDGNGTSQILNLTKKTSGAYNYNVTYKKPATSTVKSQSKFQNVNFVKTVGKDNSYTANINGIARELTAVGDPTKKADYEQTTLLAQFCENRGSLPCDRIACFLPYEVCPSGHGIPDTPACGRGRLHAEYRRKIHFREIDPKHRNPVLQLHRLLHDGNCGGSSGKIPFQRISADLPRGRKKCGTAADPSRAA